MRKFVVIAIVVAVAGGAAAYFGVFSREVTPRRPGPGGAQGGRGAQAAPAARAARPRRRRWLWRLVAASADRVAAAAAARADDG